MHVRSNALYPFEMGPLTPMVFHILLALAQGDIHGFGVGERARRDSDGRVIMTSGTLYGALKRLTEQDFIEKVVDISGKPRNYRLRPRGEALLREELRRYREAVQIADRHWLHRMKIDAYVEEVPNIDLDGLLA